MTSSPRDWRRLGLDIVRAVVLSRHGAGRAFRLDLRDGRTLKARVFTSPRWAADVERLLAAPGARACPRPIERHGNVLISEFVPGVPLDERLATATRIGSEALGTGGGPPDGGASIAAARRAAARLHRPGISAIWSRESGRWCAWACSRATRAAG